VTLLAAIPAGSVPAPSMSRASPFSAGHVSQAYRPWAGCPFCGNESFLQCMVVQLRPIAELWSNASDPVKGCTDA
jgi:hypothetical protein